ATPYYSIPKKPHTMNNTVTKTIAQGIYEMDIAHQFGFEPELDNAFKCIHRLEFVQRLEVTQTGNTLMVNVKVDLLNINSPYDVNQIASPIMSHGWAMYATTIIDPENEIIMTFFQ